MTSLTWQPDARVHSATIHSILTTIIDKLLFGSSLLVGIPMLLTRPVLNRPV